ncbi:hypothetical protein CRYO30217_00300 [Parvicella tangerina]|uniref:Peptidase S9 prolyl oligopeptidase catalytic domain-containing protein n=2 Tax=Parvicella tangerina TaxID=2829795 RepID=A0A916JJS1_9FLAO|nr:hypothetical protein CRYO30217_00300 [Parvicella tangerina]
MRSIFSSLIFLVVSQVLGQTKKAIDTDAYYEWKTISGEEISHSGRLVAYKENAYRGNDTLVLLKNGEEIERWGRVNRFFLDPNDRYVVFQQTLDYDSLRQLKIRDVNKKKWPADSLGIKLLELDSTFWLKEVESFATGEEGSLILVSHTDKFKVPTAESKKTKKKKCFLFKRKEPKQIKGDSELEGTVLTIFEATNTTMKQVEHVRNFGVNKMGTHFSYVKNERVDTLVVDQLFVGMFGGEKQVYEVAGEISNPTWSEAGNYLAFNVTVDTSEAKKQQLFVYDYAADSVFRILDTVSDHFKNYQTVSDQPIQFSEDGSKLYFQVGIKPLVEQDDTIPEDEKAKLDIWSWTDGEIQPQQLKTVKKDALGLVDYVYHIKEQQIVSLQDSSSQAMRYYQNRNSNYALLTDQSPYLHEMTWDFWYYDLYRVDVRTGDKKLLKKHVYGWQYSLSPSGKYFTFWDAADSSWHLQDVDSEFEMNLTKSIDDEFYKRDHDVPAQIGAAGSVHWLIDEKGCVIESQNEVWIVPIQGNQYKLTYGKENFESYELLELDEDEFYVDHNKGFYLKSFNHKTKAEGIYHYGKEGLNKMGEWDAKLMTIKLSKNKEHMLLEKMSFTESYNLFLGDAILSDLEQVTNVNPQQENYKWGTVELVHWRDYKGDSVNGLLYKPEDFDPSKKYPMIVYFYELYTDDIHFYYRPKPTASIIYPTEYVSNDYIVFIPDIRYDIGYPAKSAYNAIMSGTDAMLKKYPNIDSTRMGLQGQSWGGYQTAQMVTMTKRYKCAMAGAPVSNMFSAYGGVRWGSGLSRTFQYETGQSRIGATIWERPDLYTENSPLFHLPKVETPLLIMHNDGDGAVPWYQGIELYQGLRRLQKPVWMLNYNDDKHNLMKDANRMDLSIRMRAFFDHYLKNEPAPKWMVEGVPAVNKGQD